MRDDTRSTFTRAKDVECENSMKLYIKLAKSLVAENEQLNTREMLPIDRVNEN